MIQQMYHSPAAAAELVWNSFLEDQGGGLSAEEQEAGHHAIYYYFVFAPEHTKTNWTCAVVNRCAQLAALSTAPCKYTSCMLTSFLKLNAAVHYFTLLLKALHITGDHMLVGFVYCEHVHVSPAY